MIQNKRFTTNTEGTNTNRNPGKNGLAAASKTLGLTINKDMKTTLTRIKAQETKKISTRCPHCGHKGTFETVLVQDVNVQNPQGQIISYLGVRRCPNEDCYGHLFFIYNVEARTLITSPTEKIPFEKQNIPEKVLDAFEEAITCHSNSCFIASAIMIRKTLEEICLDRQAIGKNLKERIKNLGSKILVPKELLDGMNDLRLLGNDAAHIKAQTFNDVGKDEIEVSIDFAKEILKAVYQYEYLLSKLRKLKEKSNNSEA
ncbi:DUF4145 domain-containing protein [candidate division KSB1 bacterium]|nr:DUF4145 domain-containing protein [candidate division KSB1 bacterium]